VFTPRNFLAFGTRRAVDRALARLTQDKTIRRLAQGLYDYPRVHKKLGILAPNPDDVTAVLAAKTGSRVQISGARAANLLGLTDQVPAQLVYLTDGAAHRFAHQNMKAEERIEVQNPPSAEREAKPQSL